MTRHDGCPLARKLMFWGAVLIKKNQTSFQNVIQDLYSMVDVFFGVGHDSEAFNCERTSSW